MGFTITSQFKCTSRSSAGCVDGTPLFTVSDRQLGVPGHGTLMLSTNGKLVLDSAWRRGGQPRTRGHLWPVPIHDWLLPGQVEAQVPHSGVLPALLRGRTRTGSADRGKESSETEGGFWGIGEPEVKIGAGTPLTSFHPIPALSPSRDCPVSTFSLFTL